jgi:hypothetical protein
MKRCWNEREPAQRWTLFEAEATLLANRTERCRNRRQPRPFWYIINVWYFPGGVCADVS